MSRLELAQAVLRAIGYTALALTAAGVWARPSRPGITTAEALAIACRARRWAILATFGALTQFARTISLPGPVVDLTGTIVVFAVVAMGFLALDSGRRR